MNNRWRMQKRYEQARPMLRPLFTLRLKTHRKTRGYYKEKEKAKTLAFIMAYIEKEQCLRAKMDKMYMDLLLCGEGQMDVLGEIIKMEGVTAAPLTMLMPSMQRSVRDAMTESLLLDAEKEVRHELHYAQLKDNGFENFYEKRRRFVPINLLSKHIEEAKRIVRRRRARRCSRA